MLPALPSSETLPTGGQWEGDRENVSGDSTTYSEVLFGRQCRGWGTGCSDGAFVGRGSDSRGSDRSALTGGLVLSSSQGSENLEPHKSSSLEGFSEEIVGRGGVQEVDSDYGESPVFNAILSRVSD